MAKAVVPLSSGRRTWILEFLDGVGVLTEIVDKGKLQVSQSRITL